MKAKSPCEELHQLMALAEVRGAGYQCGDDEACRFVRERDEARAEVERQRDECRRWKGDYNEQLRANADLLDRVEQVRKALLWADKLMGRAINLAKLIRGNADGVLCSDRRADAKHLIDEWMGYRAWHGH